MKRQKDKENFNVLINHKKTTWAYFKQLLSKRQRNLHNSVLLESSLKIKEDTGSFTLISQTWTFCMRAERGWVRPFPGWSTVGVRWNLCCLQVHSLTLWAKQRAKSYTVSTCAPSCLSVTRRFLPPWFLAIPYSSPANPPFIYSLYSLLCLLQTFSIFSKWSEDPSWQVW